MFTPSRLTLARERRRLTKKALAEAIKVTPHTILRYESGEIEPGDETLARLANVLDFPHEFFFESEFDGIQDGAASFRSMSALTARERDAALAAGTLACLLSDWIDQRFELPPVSLIELDGDPPEAAARSLREEWGLGETPIKNMVHLLEAKGVRLFSMAENTLMVDAFSVWRSEQPFIFLNTMKSAERSRFDAAHELGHLVLHKHGGPKGRSAEDEADRFAASFLMPAADVEAMLPRVRTLNQVVEAKKRWGASAMALLVRLNRLNILSGWQYRTLVIQATEAGYRESEPFPMSRELSIVWQKVLTTLWNERVTKSNIARALYVPVEEIENLLFGLTVAPQGDDSNAIRPPLRLVSD